VCVTLLFDPFVSLRTPSNHKHSLNNISSISTPEERGVVYYTSYGVLLIMTLDTSIIKPFIQTTGSMY